MTSALLVTSVASFGKNFLSLPLEIGLALFHEGNEGLFEILREHQDHVLVFGKRHPVLDGGLSAHVEDLLRRLDGQRGVGGDLAGKIPSRPSIMAGWSG